MRSLLPLVLLSVQAACQPVGADPTWHADVAPLVAERCGGCHGPGLIGPFSLQTYEQAEPIADWIAAVVADGTMPPWDARRTAECPQPRPLRDDPSLSAAEIDLLARWADAGAPEGDPGTAAPLPSAITGDLDSSDIERQVEEAWTVRGDGDSYRCFVLDPGLTETTWITGLQLVPDSLDVSHHALIWLDSSGVPASLAQDGSYDCFGSGGADGPLIGVWVPGAAAQEYPPDSGIEAPPGAVLAVQMHYNGVGVDTPDRPGVRLRTTTEPPPLKAQITLVGNEGNAAGGLQPGPADAGLPRFLIPAGATGHTETIRWTVPASVGQVGVFGVGPHMHLLGVDMKVHIERPVPYGGQPPVECLVHTPTYDYHWQRLYQFDEPDPYALPRVRGGDTLVLRCTFDNTLDNDNLAVALASEGLAEPVDVGLGAGTFDEMCLAAFGVVYPR